MITQKITPYLWVEKDAKAVADYYLSIFKDGKLKDFRKFEVPVMYYRPTAVVFHVRSCGAKLPSWRYQNRHCPSY